MVEKVVLLDKRKAVFLKGMVRGVDMLVELGLLQWSESPSVLYAHTATGICIKSCARNKYVLISSANRPCEPGQNQTFKFVYLLGK